MSEETSKNDFFGKYSLSFLSIGILVVFLGIVFFLYFWVSKKNNGGIVFPAGLNYTGEETTPAPPVKKPVYDYAALGAAPDSEWISFKSIKSQYTFKHPNLMIPLIFPGDVNDSTTFDVADVPAQFNILVLVETISNYDPKFTGKQEEFVKNYWKFFGGLKGLQSAELFTNEKGLTGFKSVYLNKSGVSTGDNYFFIFPNDGNKIMHMSNVLPKEGETVFLRMLNSLELAKPK